jgi:hypothetical protein
VPQRNCNTARWSLRSLDTLVHSRSNVGASGHDQLDAVRKMRMEHMRWSCDWIVRWLCCEATCMAASVCTRVLQRHGEGIAEAL